MSLVVILLLATGAAFVVTEQLKLTLSPILYTQVDKTFSPTCACPTAVARFAFRLRKADRLTITVTRNTAVVRTLIQNQRFGRLVGSSWNGRSDTGRLVRDGVYLIRVHLAAQRRTILLPNPITLDTQAPHAILTTIRPRRFSPDGDGRADRITVFYRFDETARPLLVVNGRVRVIGRFANRAGSMEWYGKTASKTFPAGTYRISVQGRDTAGNLSTRTPPQTVAIRFVALARHRIASTPGRRFRIGVSTDAARFRWSFAGRTGTASPRRPLILRAPSSAGRYPLVVSERGHSDHGLVTVR